MKDVSATIDIPAKIRQHTAKGCELGDIKDVRVFAEWQVWRVHRKLHPHDREEASASAPSILFDLFVKWDPEKCASFSAYALAAMPKRLIDWHRRELRQSSRGSRTGPNEWSFRNAVTLDSIRGMSGG